MALPPPTAAVAHAHAHAPAVVAAPVAVATGEKPKKILPKFGPGRGDDKIAVPVVNGIDGVAMIEKIAELLKSCGIADLGAAAEAFDAVPKDKFPGNKQGRAAYQFGTVLKSVAKCHNSLHREKGERKARVKTSDKFKALLEQMAAQFGGMDKIKAAVGEDALKKLKLI